MEVNKAVEVNVNISTRVPTLADSIRLCKESVGTICVSKPSDALLEKYCPARK